MADSGEKAETVDHTGVPVADSAGTPGDDRNTFPDVPKIDIDEVAEDNWNGLDADFSKKASLEIARYILLLFGAVYLFCFILVCCLFRLKDATFDGGIEVIRLFLSSIIPLVTLAVGYYLGDRSSSD